jgi:hypothetical protein
LVKFEEKHGAFDEEWKKKKPHSCKRQLYIGLKEVVAPFRGGGGTNLMSLSTLGQFA